MTKLFFTLLLFFSFQVKAQMLSGTVVDSGRKMTTSYSFKIKGKYKGFKYFELAVNNEGKVTGIVEKTKDNSMVSTPAKLIAIKELDKLQFEKGMHFPKFQHVLVQIEFVKE